MYTAMARLGFGRHTAAIPPARRETLATLEAAVRLAYVPTAALVGTSSLVYMYRLCPHAWVRTMVAGLIGAYALLAMAAASFSVFQCSPVRYFDLPDSRPAASAAAAAASGTCIADPARLAVGLPVAAAVANLLTWSVPVAVAVSTHFLSWRAKALSVAVALLATVSCGVGGAVRLPILYRMHHPQRGANHVHDPLWDAVSVGLFASYSSPRPRTAAWGLM